MTQNAKHIKKLCLGVVLLIAKRSGTSTTHPNQPRLYGGKAKVIKNPDKIGAREKGKIKYFGFQYVRRSTKSYCIGHNPKRKTIY